MLKHEFSQPRGILIAGLVALLASAPLSATEELTVNGSDAAMAAQAERERFRSDMAVYVQAVDSEIKATRDASLRKAVAPALQLASSELRTRG